MVLPEGSEAMTEKQLAKALEDEVGYSKDAAEYIASVIKGTITPDVPLM